MGHLKRREYVVGTFFLVVGLGYLLLTSQLPRSAFVDAAFIPYILGAGMSVLGVMQLRQAARLTDKSEASEQADSADYATVLKTLGLIVAYATLFMPVGFPIVTVLYLFMQFIVLTPVDKKVNYVSYGLIAVMTSAIVYLVFRHGFDMILPTGPLGNFID